METITTTFCGIAGTMERIGRADGKTFAKQVFKTERRPIPSEGKGYTIQAEIRFDDNCKNGHNSFAITGTVYRRDGGLDSCGCVHEPVALAFPEIAHLIKWHLFDSDGPMHYVANTVYHAGDRDHNGLRAGEKKPIMARDGIPHWELVAVNSVGVAISTTETGLKYQGAETVPLFILTKDHKGESVPFATPVLRWQQLMRTGEGKPRDLEAARHCAVWPDATDAELSQEPDALKTALLARLPTLVDAFKGDLLAAGMQWNPED